MADLTKAQLGILRHMLGINTPTARTPQPYRNYYGAVPGDPNMIELEKLGMVEPCGHAFRLDYYRATDAGRKAAIDSHKTIRRSAASRRYSKFLDLRDVFHELTFREFLTHPDFEEARRNA